MTNAMMASPFGNIESVANSNADASASIRELGACLHFVASVLVGGVGTVGTPTMLLFALIRSFTGTWHLTGVCVKH